MSDHAQLYIRRIRNKPKRQYAAEYYGWCVGLLEHEPQPKCSPMAAQAVRKAIYRMGYLSPAIRREREALEAMSTAQRLTYTNSDR